MPIDEVAKTFSKKTRRKAKKSSKMQGPPSPPSKKQGPPRPPSKMQGPPSPPSSGVRGANKFNIRAEERKAEMYPYKETQGPPNPPYQVRVSGPSTYQGEVDELNSIEAEIRRQRGMRPRKPNAAKANGKKKKRR